MKTLLFALSLLFSAGTALAQTTQVINSNIRMEFQFYEFNTYADGDDASSGGLDDIVVKLNMTLLPSGFEFNETCTTWQCDAPCNYFSDLYYWHSNRSFEERFTLEMEAWESDNTTWCTDYANDDYYWSGSATLANNGRITDSPEAVWGFLNGFASLPSDWLFFTSGHYDAKVKIAWRYVAGETLDNPLQFGTLAPGQTIEHFGSTRPNPAGLQSDLDLGWKNDLGSASPDVFFSFSLDQPAEVVISTDYTETNFDSYLRLYDSWGSQLDSDDDSGVIGNGGFAAVMTNTLEPGTYRFMVEGKYELFGDYKLTIQTTAVSAAEEQFVAADWSVFPNPAKDHVSVNIQAADLDADARLMVHDLLGREVLAQDARAGTQQLDLSALDPGVYAVQIRSGGASGVRKVVVE